MGSERDAGNEPEQTPGDEPEQTPPAEPTPPQEPVDTPAEPQVTPNDDVTKLKEQVSNLSIALKKEREEGGKRVEEFERKLTDKLSVLDRIGEVFNPNEPQQEEPQSVGLSKDELDRLVEEKLSEFKEEQVRDQKIEEYKTEIKNLEKEWDGSNGKPKYDDQEVLDWQRDNQKTYLSPRDAFMQMKQNEIVDYKVKQRLDGANPAEPVETPSQAGDREPANNDSFEKNVTMDTRAAAMQAMEDASKEM